MKTITTLSEQETISAGVDCAKQLQQGDVVACFGDLGSGKTQFIKGICQGLGVKQHVASPTFTIINEYVGSGVSVYHIDLYRVRNTNDIQELGFEEYLYNDGICLIEWAEKIVDLLPAKRYDVFFQFGERENIRKIVIAEPQKVTV